MTEHTDPLNRAPSALEGIPGIAFFEHSGAANMLVAHDTTLITVNSRFEDLTGYSKEEVEGKMSWTKLVHPEDLGIMLESHRLRRENPDLVPQNYEYRYITSGGETRWGMLTGATLANGSRTLISVVDITELKKKEAELLRTENLYQDIVQTQSDLISRFTPDLVLTFVNDAYCRYFGEAREELVGRSFLHHIPPEDADNQKGYYETLTLLRPTNSIEEAAILPSGEIRWQHWEDKGIFDDQGDLVEIQSIGRDITDLRNTSEKLEETIEKLCKSFYLAIEMAGRIIEVRDPSTAGHQRRTAEIAVAMAVEMGLTEDEITATKLASLAHDVGKIRIPTEILSKPGVLQSAEWGIIRQHPIYSAEILKTLGTPWDLAGIALQHHERYDGSGYPEGLSGEEIRVEARVLAVADVIEAMSSDRPYRPGFGIELALEEIEAGRGVRYDPASADAALCIFREKGFWK